MKLELRSLNEIKEIMNAMKNISLMEVHKLARFRESQRRVVDGLEAAAADFMQFHRPLFPNAEKFREFHLLVGSERGFCGDFNDTLIRAFETGRSARKNHWCRRRQTGQPNWTATRACARRLTEPAWSKR